VASHGLSVLQLYTAVGAIDTDQVTVVQAWLGQSAS